MGTDYLLFRLREPLQQRKKIDEGDCLPFGDRASLYARLAALPSMQSRPPDRLRLERAGASFDFTLGGDPVFSIAVRHAAPWHLQPIAGELADLAPLAVFDPQENAWIDAATLAPEGPAAIPLPFASPAAVRDALGDGWSVTLAEPIGQDVQLLPLEDRLLVAGGGVLSALDAASGRGLWSRRVGRGHLYAARAKGLIVCGSDHPRAFAFDRDGNTVWEAPVEGRVVIRPLVFDDLVAFGTEAGLLTAFSRRDGTRRWEQSIGGSLMAAAAGRGLVVAGNNLGAVVCVRSDGTRLGRYDFAPIAENRGLALRSRAIFSLVVDGSDALARVDQTLLRLRLPELSVRSTVEVSHPGVRWPMAIEGGWLAESARPEPGGFDPATRTVHKGRTVVRARDLATLEIRFEHECPAGAPPPIALTDGRGLAFVSAGERAHRLVIFDSRSGAILRSGTPSEGYLGALAADGTRWYAAAARHVESRGLSGTL